MEKGQQVKGVRGTTRKTGPEAEEKNLKTSPRGEDVKSGKGVQMQKKGKEEGRKRLPQLRKKNLCKGQLSSRNARPDTQFLQRVRHPQRTFSLGLTSTRNVRPRQTEGRLTN